VNFEQLLDHPGARYLTPPTPGRAHYTGAVAKVHRALWGHDPMPHQALWHRLNTEVLEDGSWAYRTTINHIPRQAGKTSGESAVSVHRCMVRPLSRVWFTAQSRQDARDTVVSEWGPRWRRSVFASLAKLRESQGSEGLYFKGTTDASLRAFPPVEGGLDGKANERVVSDEPWRIDPVTGQALDNSISPTFLTTGGQFAMISTAGTARSTWLWGYVGLGREAVRLGERQGVALVDFGIPDDAAPHLRDLLSRGRYGPAFDEAVAILAHHNPANGYSLKLDALAAAVRQSLGDKDEGGVDGVLRAYGNHWTRAAQTLIPLELFDKAHTAGLTDADAPSSAALGVAQGIDRADVVAYAVWRDATGRPFAALVDAGDVADGPDLLALARRSRTWAGAACVGAGPVLEAVDAAERRHNLSPFTRLTAREYATGCAQVLTLFLEELIAHDGAPGSALRSAVDGVAKRKVDDGGWAWGRAGSEGSIAALEALTAALWAHDHAKTIPAPDVR
jgi:hypothetical protein